ncbi:MAG: Gfo/Idh/MocA family oxidoreductase [Bryobacterales bacterium]|nr:Gfo/Idh/MocA family oxidoreductase [Bryobacterales bacterium]
MKIGIVGLGFMGSTHLKAIKKLEASGPHPVELVAVADARPELLAGDLSAIQGNIGGPGEKYDFSSIGRYEDWRDLLNDPNVEVVDFCTPTFMHVENAVTALKAGKHVLVEKPMAISTADTDTMLAAAKASGKTLMVAQVLRFVPAYRQLRETILSGAVGKPIQATFRRRCAAPFWSSWLSDPKRSGGAIIDLLIHDIDFVVHTFGEPESVSAIGVENLQRGLDVITATLRYADNLNVIIQGGWYHPKAFPFSMEYNVVCEGATFEFSSLVPEPTEFLEDGSQKPLPLPDQDGYEAEMAYFVECISTGKAPEFCPPEESAAGVRLANKLKEARERNGEPLS